MYNEVALIPGLHPGGRTYANRVGLRAARGAGAENGCRSIIFRARR